MRKSRRAGDKRAATPRAKGKRLAGDRHLDDVAAFIGRFVSCTELQRDALALWVAHTHIFDIADATPYIWISSPDKASGKTRLLEVLELLVNEPWLTARVTPAVLARRIEAQTPTLLLDELDAALGSGREYGEALRGILNAGHRRGGRTSIAVASGR